VQPIDRCFIRAFAKAALWHRLKSYPSRQNHGRRHARFDDSNLTDDYAAI
jgi:hypothetical protein